MTAAPWMAGAGFALLCALLLTLPFVPAFREWLRPTDDAALPVSANYTSDIDHFARRLQADAAARLGRGPATGYEDFEIIESAHDAIDWSAKDRRLLALQALRTDTAIHSARQLYVDGDLQAGERSLFPSVYASGNLTLGPASEVHDWAHADRRLSIGHHGVAMRRISAGEAIVLGQGSWFERLHAPAVRFGEPRPVRLASLPQPGSLGDIPEAIQRTPVLFMVRGDCVLPPGRVYHGSLVVTGFLTVGAGTVVHGDIKARGGLTLASGAVVHGALTSEDRVYLQGDSRADGPVVSETDILLGAGSVVGLPDALTTVTARNIVAESGAVVHGMVWAHEVGLVREVAS